MNSEVAANLAQEAQEIDTTITSLQTELAALSAAAKDEHEKEAQLDDFEQQCGYALASGLLLVKLRGAVVELNAKEEAATMANRKRSHAVATAANRPSAAARRTEATRSNQLPQTQRKKQRRDEDVEEIDDADSPPVGPAPRSAATAAKKKRSRDSQDRSSAASSAARSIRQKRTSGHGSQQVPPAPPPWVTEEDDDLELEAPAQQPHQSHPQGHSQQRPSGGRGGVAPTAPVAPLSYATLTQRPSGGSSNSSGSEVTASSDRLRGGQGGSSARMAGPLKPVAEGMLFQPPPPPPASSLLPSLSRPAGMAQRTSTHIGAQGDWQPHPFTQLVQPPRNGTMMDDFATTSAHHWPERWHR
jgi:hypothetical protein